MDNQLRWNPRSGLRAAAVVWLTTEEFESGVLDAVQDWQKELFFLLAEQANLTESEWMF